VCGIAGWYHLDGGAARGDALDAMLSRLHHRGPDSRGVFVEGPVALGVHRLSILDVSVLGDQPALDPEAGAALVYNGELYNYRELGKELEARGVRFHSSSDTEVVLRALAAWGPEEAVRRFSGMFAFAYYERRARALWLARDPLGIKPLVTSARPGAYVFGSEAKSLLQHPLVACQPDREAIRYYLLNERFDAGSTPFRDVRAFPPGHLARVAGGEVRTRPYFDALDAVDLGRRPRRGWVTDLEDALAASVRGQVVSDAPVATLCSGGLDSSYLTALASRERPLTAYVANVEGARPEAARARRVADHLGLPLTLVDVDAAAFLRAWPQATWFGDAPTSFGSDPALYLVTRRCREDGIKVLLTGEGADEILCGYPWLWQGADLVERPAVSGLLARLLGRRRERLWPLLADLAGDVRQAWSFGSIEAPDPYRPLREALAFHGGEALLRRRRLLRELSAIRDPGERMVLAASLNCLSGHLSALLHRADRMGMGNSVECRVPYLDTDVVGLALSMPVGAKLRGRTGKHALKRAAVKRLPADLVRAPKWGFSVNRDFYRDAAWLLRDGVARELLEWSGDTTEQLVSELLAAPRPVVLFTAVSLELWGRVFLRGESPEGLGEQMAAALPTRR
jgi:asparagine synthase (glutamine-hydrolysing)